MASPVKSSQKFTYDSRLGAGGMYRNEQGRIVKNEVIVRELERVQRGVKREADALAAQLQTGDIDLQTFYDGFRQKLKTLHGLAGAIAKGGIERLDATDWGHIGAQSKKQYQWLNTFVKQLESGEQPLNGNFMRRTRMYIDAAKRSYYNVRTNAAQKAGFNEERRVLGPAEHCESKGGLTGCIEWAALGWQPIGTLGQIGDSPCRSNCQCTKEFRKSILEPAANEGRWDFIKRIIPNGKQLGFNR